MPKLTNASALRLTLPQSGTKTVYCSALPALGVRLNSGGKRSWVAKVARRKVTLGDVRVVPVADARKAAAELAAKATLGQWSPATTSTTLGAALDDYIATVIARRSRSYGELWVSLRKHLKPLEAKKLAAVQRADVLAVLRKLEAKPGMQDVAHKLLRAFFNHCANEQLIAASPLVGYRRPMRCQPRSGVYADAQLKLIWRAPDLVRHRQLNRVMRALVISGCRVNEVVGLQPEDVTPEGFTVPAERTKTNKALTVVLPEPMRAELAVWQFGQISARQVLEGLRRVTGTAKTTHDVRRTAATKMLELGVQPHIVSLCLNHVPAGMGGVERSYFHYDYAVERAEALALYFEWLERL